MFGIFLQVHEISIIISETKRNRFHRLRDNYYQSWYEILRGESKIVVKIGFFYSIALRTVLLSSLDIGFLTEWKAKTIKLKLLKILCV